MRAVVLACVLAALTAQAAAARPTRIPDACKLLKSALQHETVVWTSHLTHFVPTGRLSCNVTDGQQSGPGHYWSASFGYLPPAAWASAAAPHKYWQSVWNHWRGKTGDGLTVARLRGFGADDAFGVEKTGQDPELHTDTWIEWVKGGYEGRLELVGEGQLGDLEDAEGLLKQLMRGIPRS